MHELPRNEQQVSYVKRTTEAMSGTSNCADELSIVMQCCKEEDESGRFIRDRAAPETATILVTNMDMVKFVHMKENSV